MPVDHKEKGFEQAIEHDLLTHGYEKGDPLQFNPRLALDPVVLVRFLKDTQPKEWSKLANLYGGEADTKVVETIAQNLDQRGILDCIRHGVTDRGVKLRLAFFQPATGMNPETLELYKKNILTVTRQVHFSEKKPHLSVDMLLSLNGLPVASAELKNPNPRQDLPALFGFELSAQDWVDHVVQRIPRTCEDVRLSLGGLLDAAHELPIEFTHGLRENLGVIERAGPSVASLHDDAVAVA